MNVHVYKWGFISVLVVIGILQFFDLPDALNYIGLVIAIFFAVMFFRLKFKK